MDTNTITKDQIKEELIEFLCQQFLVEQEDIILDESLIDTGIIDSMGLIEIASHIEEKYGFKTTEEQMNRNNYGSVLKLVDFINSNKV